jgi:DNA repair exonuclease SbcCD nuclease subunit
LKILIIGDIHLHINKEADWEHSRLMLLAHEIAKQNADMVVLAGDVFDYPRPNLESEKAFYDFIDVINKVSEVWVIAGNHEELGQGKTTYDFIPEVGFKYCKDPVRLQLTSKLDLWMVGHNQLTQLKTIKKQLQAKQNILISHIRCGVGRFVKPEIDFTNIVPYFDKIILGDIHTRTFPYANVEYTSQPYRTHYVAPADCGMVLLNIDKTSFSTEYIKLTLPSKNLLEVAHSDLDVTLKGLNKTDLYKLRVFGTIEELNNIPKIPSNVKIEPVLTKEQADREDIVEEFKNSGKIDITETLLKLTKQVDNLSEEALTAGQQLLADILRDYK